MSTRCLGLGFSLAFAVGCGGGVADADAGAAGSKFFLPTGSTGTNTSPPTIVADAAGTIHAVYPAYTRGGAFYGECGAGCTDSSAMKTVAFATAGTATNAMLALDPSGHPRVLLATGTQIIYATCSSACTDAASWTQTTIIQHAGDRNVTGEAFALDPQGRPRFIMHTPIAYLGIGQQPPVTEWVACDRDCERAASWKRSQIGTQILGHATLRFDATGKAHLATVAIVDGASIAAYESCESNCGAPDAWASTSFGTAFHSEVEAVTIHDQIVLALTSTGQPRVLAMIRSATGQRQLVYYACSAANCTASGAWTGTIVSDSAKLGPGYDLQLDAQDHPRLALTFDYNIAMASCDTADCTANGTSWNVTVVEAGTDLPADHIFLYPNCSVGAWLLHGPSLALTASGSPRIAYTARDVSAAGVSTTDPGQPACVAGTDLLLGRLAILK